MTIRDQVHALFEETFPAQGGKASLEFAEVQDRGKKLAIVLRLVILDVNEETCEWQVMDVRQSESMLSPPADLARFAAFLRALVRVAERALEHPNTYRLMPCDLVKFDALALSTAKTEDDFVKALCQKSRLGKYITGDISAVVPPPEWATVTVISEP